MASIRILAIEDNPGDVRLIQEALLEEFASDFLFNHAPNLKEALEWLETNECDVILQDLSLPDSDGMEGIEKTCAKRPSLPIVVLTGQNSKHTGVEAVKKGAQDFICKGNLSGELLDRVIHYAIQRKETEGKIKEASRIKAEFTSMVSHELRTPMAVMSESVSIVLDGLAGPISSEQKMYLDITKRNIDRLGRLINNVLDFQKYESRPWEITVAETDIYRLLDEIAENFYLPAKNKNIELRVDPEENLPRILLDPDKINQVLTNLINNAIKNMEKGRIILSARRLQNAVRIAVEDQGPGIGEEDIPKLFKAYGQLATSDGRNPGGTGLGLAICKQIIDAHRGKIGVESTRGQGAKFYFILPIQERRNSLELT